MKSEVFEFEIFIHKFFVSSKGWERIPIVGSLTQIEEKAKALCYERTNEFQHCSYYLNPIKRHK